MGPDATEEAAYAVVRHVTGHAVTHTDDGTRPRMVDGMWTDDAGARHAVEVTRLTDPDMGELEAEMFARDHRLAAPDLDRRWTVWFEPGVRIDRLTDQLPPMLAHCETVGCRRIRDLPWLELDDWPLGRLVRDGDLDGYHDDEPNPGHVSLQFPARGGGAAGMEVIPPWLTRALVVAPLAGKVDKLDRWDADVRHLFVAIDMDGAPFHVAYAFWDHDAVPEAPPRLPDGLDAVWLVYRFASGHPLTWLPSRGWERHDLSGAQGSA